MAFVFNILFKADGTNDVSAQVDKTSKAIEKMGKSLEDNIRDMAAKYVSWGFVKELAARVDAYSESIMHNASAIKAMSDRYGVSIETMQVWAIAAQENGATADDLGEAFKNLKLKQKELKDTSDRELAEAFWRLGASLEDVRTKKPEQLFQQMATYLSKVPSAASQLTDAIEVMGRSAEKVLPAMKANFEEVAKAARETGQIIPTDLVKKLSEIEDKTKAKERVRQSVNAPRAIGWQSVKENVWDTFWNGMFILAGENLRNVGFKKFGSELVRSGAISQLADAAINNPPAPKAGRSRTQVVQLPNDLGIDSLKTAADFSSENPATRWGGQADALARIGLFRGGADSMSLARQHLSQLNRIRQELATLNRRVEQSAREEN